MESTPDSSETSPSFLFIEQYPFNGTRPAPTSRSNANASTPQPPAKRCQETKPACANCVTKDLECVYPPRGEQEAQKNGRLASELSPQRISTTPFTGDDLRFFHHFLIDARPVLPWGSESAWMSDIPAYAHDCPHLLHAVLSLGASHCALITPNGSQYKLSAMAHRGKALKGLGELLAKGDDCTVTEMDGALATCYALTFQAHHMADGLVDFAVMVRGCGIVTNWFSEETRKSTMFLLPGPEEAITTITSWLPEEPQPITDAQAVEVCIVSLDRLEPLFTTPAHREFYTALRLGYSGLLISHREAFIHLSSIYAIWGRMKQDEFLTFIAPGNHVSRALFVHYITFDLLLQPVHLELGNINNVKVDGGRFLIYRWVEAVYSGLPLEMQELVWEQVELIAVDLAPQLDIHRELYPRWNHELPAFAQWLQKRIPKEDGSLYKI